MEARYEILACRLSPVIKTHATATTDKLWYDMLWCSRTALFTHSQLITD